MLPLIDTHQHLWDLSKLELPWTSSISKLNQSFLMEDYLEASMGHNVRKTVYMEVDVHLEHRQKEVELISEICSDDSNIMQAAIFCSDPGGPDLESFISIGLFQIFFQAVRISVFIFFVNRVFQLFMVVVVVEVKLSSSSAAVMSTMISALS